MSAFSPVVRVPWDAQRHILYAGGLDALDRNCDSTDVKTRHPVADRGGLVVERTQCVSLYR